MWQRQDEKRLIKGKMILILSELFFYPRFIEIWSAIGSRLGENRGLCLASQIWIVVFYRGQLIESAIVEQIESGNDADFGNDGRFESATCGLASAIVIASGSENRPPEIKK